MDKNCNSCYWKRGEDYKSHCYFKDEKYGINPCDNFTYKCECEMDSANYEYKDKIYCEDCIKTKLGIQEYTITHYSDANGEYLGNEEDDFIDILIKCDRSIKELR